MTKLEEELFFAIHGLGLPDDPRVANTEFTSLLKDEAIAAAEVAQKYIRKAFTQGVSIEHYEAWAKENGITE